MAQSDEMSDVNDKVDALLNSDDFSDPLPVTSNENYSSNSRSPVSRTPSLHNRSVDNNEEIDQTM
jgi:hypothetical protein